MERRRFLIAVVLVVGYFGGWVLLGMVTGVADNTPPQYVEGEPEGAGWTPFLIYGVLLGLFVGLAAYAGMRLIRQRGVRFADLDEAEQERRREAGKLLHDR